MTYLDQIQGEDRRQRQDLTDRLKELIRNYPEGVTILKELLQNADDAGAKRLVLTIDWRDMRSKATPDEGKIREYLGPGLLAWNDSCFRPEDFEAISHIGKSAKVTDYKKTGRFGHGFNAVYNITDFPCYVSRNRVVFFDPHERYFRKENAFTFGTLGDNTNLWEHLPTLLNTFEAGGFSLNEYGEFEGTLFRLPFRISEHAEQSEIKNEAFDRTRMETLLTIFAEDGEHLLLFLKNILSIEIREIEESASNLDGFITRNRLYIGTENEDEVVEARKSVLSALDQEPEEFWMQCRARGSLPIACYKHRINTTTSSAQGDQLWERQSTWRIVNGLRSDLHGEVIRSMQEMAKSKNKAVPWAGAAARISTSQPDTSPVKGRTFCFLPLPQSASTGLPIHIHGFFDLDDSRTNLTTMDSSLTGDARIRGEWNCLLVRHAVAPMCARLVEALKEDIGDDMKRFYATWPIQKPMVKALEELPKYVLEHLKEASVIRIEGTKRWQKPTVVKTLKAEFRDLKAPLALLGYSTPCDDLPFDATVRSRLGVTELDPESVRNTLIQPAVRNTANGQPPEKDAHPALQRRDWIIHLLRFCLSDGSTSVLNLPLALRADGGLAVFDGKTFEGSLAVRAIFADHPHWFLASDMQEKVPELQQVRVGIPQFQAVTVALDIGKLFANTDSNQPWEPEGVHIPNAAWLIRVYDYLAGLPKDAITGDALNKLQACPLVPGSDGRLYHGGDALTPLYPHKLSPSVRQTLEQFQVPIVGTGQNRELGKAIANYVESQPNELIFHTTAHDVVDTIEAQKDIWIQKPPSDADFDLLLDFLSDNIADIRDDSDRLDTLRQLPLYRLSGKEGRITLAQQKVYLTETGVRPPDVAGEVRIAQTGAKDQWRSLLVALQVPELTGVRILRECILKQYADLAPEQKKAALIWIRENLDATKGELRRRGDLSTDLTKEVTEKILIQCTNGDFLPIDQVYDPDSKDVRDILRDTAPVPDFAETYRDDVPAWREFFRSLGWHSEPLPHDVLYRIDDLMDSAMEAGMESVELDIRRVFEYFADADRWKEKFAHSQVWDNDKLRPFAEALSVRAWIPVQRGELYLRRYPAARTPENRLHYAKEVTFVQYGNQAASQFALFLVDNPAGWEIQSALGFPVPGSEVMDQAVFAHFEQFLIWFATLPEEKQEPKLAQTILPSVYGYMNSHFVNKTQSHQDMQTRFADKPCLWDGSRFWSPKKCFAEKAEIFGGRRGNVHGNKLDAVFKMLGQQMTPSPKDLIDFLQELHDEYEEEPLDNADSETVLKIALSLSKDANDIHQQLRNDLPLLSADCRLIASFSLLINDDPFRAVYVEKHIVASGLALLHKSIPRDLADIVGCPSLFAGVDEKLTAKPKSVTTEDSNRWTTRLKSPEFYMALRRLARHQGREDNLPIGVEHQLKRTSFVVSGDLVVNLILNGTTTMIAHNVPTNFYTEHQSAVIYIRESDDESMRSFCAEALNRNILEGTLDDLSILEKLFNRNPKEYEWFLNDRRIRPLIDEPDDYEEEDEPIVTRLLELPDDSEGFNGTPVTNWEAEPTEPTMGEEASHRTIPPVSTEGRAAAESDAKAVPTRHEVSGRGAHDESESPTTLKDASEPDASPTTETAVSEEEVIRTPPTSPFSNGSGSRSDWSFRQGRETGNTPSRSGQDSDRPQNRRDDADEEEEISDSTSSREASDTQPLPPPSAHSAYHGQVHSRTPIRPIDADLLRQKHPDAKITPVSEIAKSRNGSRRSRSQPGYTGPQEPVNNGQITLLARSLRDGMLHLQSPKPAALFQPDEASQGAYFPTLLSGEDTDREPLHLRVDFNKEVLHFDDGADRERILTFIEEHGLHPGCLLTIRLQENGYYRVGYEAEPVTVKPVPLLGLDDHGNPIVTWHDEGIELPCPVNTQLFLGQRRFADEEASMALWRMAEDAPDIMEALQRLLRNREKPLSVDDLYRLNFHIRPVSYSYFQWILQANTGLGKLFIESASGISLSSDDVTEIVTPQMASKQGRRGRQVDWAEIRQLLQSALSDRQFSVEDKVEYILLGLEEILLY